MVANQAGSQATRRQATLRLSPDMIHQYLKQHYDAEPVLFSFDESDTGINVLHILAI